jgi:hypothetical protein
MTKQIIIDNHFSQKIYVFVLQMEESKQSTWMGKV